MKRPNSKSNAVTLGLLALCCTSSVAKDCNTVAGVTYRCGLGVIGQAPDPQTVARQGIAESAEKNGFRLGPAIARGAKAPAVGLYYPAGKDKQGNELLVPFGSVNYHASNMVEASDAIQQATKHMESIGELIKTGKTDLRDYPTITAGATEMMSRLGITFERKADGQGSHLLFHGASSCNGQSRPWTKSAAFSRRNDSNNDATVSHEPTGINVPNPYPFPGRQSLNASGEGISDRSLAMCS